MSISNNKNICVLDLGNSKAVALVVAPSKNWEIIGYGYNKSNGFKNGVITNINEVEKTILKVIETAENSSGVDIHEVYLNIPCENLIFKKHTSTINTAGSQITNKDIHKLLVQTLESCENNEMALIHTLPLCYMLDGNNGIENPLGMYGSQLSCEYMIVSAPLSYIMNIENCFNKCQIELKQLIAEPVSISNVLGFNKGYNLVLGIGGNCSSLSIYDNGQIVSCQSIHLGGVNITNDLVQCLNISQVDAEKIKTLNADYNATDTTQTINLNDVLDDDEQSIDLSTANEVIQARVDEILELLSNKFSEVEYQNLLPNFMYVIGGTSNLLNFHYAVEKAFLKEMVSPSVEHLGLPEELKNCFGVTAVGMVKYLQNIQKDKNINSENAGGFLKQTLQWVKKSLVG